MTRPALAPAVLMLFLTSAATAQEAAPPPETGEVEDGFSLIEEGTKLILRGLLDRVEPTLKDMGEDLDNLMAEMEPALRDLAGLIGDIRNYHPPEMLPNGDIILRRKVPLDPEAAPEGEGVIDL
jgi:hypothetical protein